MKRPNFIFISITAIAMLFAGCEKDNYKAPKSLLTGQVQYDGQAVGLRSNGVQLELWQHNFQLFNKIPVYVAQDGSFSAEIFDGDYKLTLVRGNGPWADKLDSLDVHVKGATHVDVPVDLYYHIKDETFERQENTVKVSVTLQEGKVPKGLERVKLYVGQTVLVDDIINIGSADRAGADIEALDQPITLQVDIPASSINKGYVFARIGVKTEGAAEFLYGKATKITIQ